MSSPPQSSSSNPPPTLRGYTISERLGQGSYGEVFKAHRNTGAREVVAIKCIQRSKISKHGSDNLIREISLMKELKHEHIVQLTNFDWDKSYIYIVMEYCGGGDLSRFIKSRKKLSEDVCRAFLQQVAAAMRYLRSKDVAHMDLKPGNILLTGGRRKQVLKLADFGFATHLTEDQTQSSICGSPLYMAPEILDRKYDAKVDLWSIGVILYECLFGRAPYKSETREEVYAKLRSEQPIVIPRKADLSDECLDLLTRCLQRDPAKRIEFDEFFSHPFLDLEHLPSEESEAKARTLFVKGESEERSGNVQAAFDLYTDALKYLVPLVKSCKEGPKRDMLTKKTIKYMEKAEELKLSLAPAPSTSDGASASTSSREPSIRRKHVSRLQQRTSVERTSFDELLEMSSVTPRMTTGLEIAKAAEDYELEMKYKVALDKYKTALDILLPLLGTEPAGRRQKLLKGEVSRWLGRAEMVEKLLSIQEEVLSRKMALDVNDDGPEKASKTCKIQ